MSKCRKCGTPKFSSKDICVAVECERVQPVRFTPGGARRMDRHNRQPISLTTKHGFHEPAITRGVVFA